MLGGRFLDGEIGRTYDEVPRWQPWVQVSLGVARDLSGEPSPAVYELAQPMRLAHKAHRGLKFRHYLGDPTMAPAGSSVIVVTFLDVAQTVVVLALVYLLAPMFLIVPLMVASVIAADSFAGEKARKTLEALLYAPATDQDLYLAELLSAWLPALVVALAGFLLYALVANLAAWPVMGELFFPNTMWLLLVFWVAPAAAGLGLSVMVLVSSRAQGFQNANQIGSAIVIPIVLLVMGQATGVMVFSAGVVALLGLVFWIVDGVLLWLWGCVPLSAAS